MFLGKDSNRIDDKGRLAIPAKFREVVGPGARLVVTQKVLDPCLEVFTEADWRAYLEKVQGLSQVKEQVRRYRRMICSGAEFCNLDRQGRILVPAPLREYAGLTRDTVLVGTGHTFEIWDATRWATEVDRDVNASGLADALAELGL